MIANKQTLLKLLEMVGDGPYEIEITVRGCAGKPSRAMPADTILETRTTGDIDWTSLPAMLTIAEVSAILRLSQRKTYGLVWDKALESVRFGRSIRIPKEALMRYLRA